MNSNITARNKEKQITLHFKPLIIMQFINIILPPDNTDYGYILYKQIIRDYVGKSALLLALVLHLGHIAENIQ